MVKEIEEKYKMRDKEKEQELEEARKAQAEKIRELEERIEHQQHQSDEGNISTDLVNARELVE